MIKQQITELKISMYNIIVMQVCDRLNKLQHDAFDLPKAKISFLFEYLVYKVSHINLTMLKC